GRQREERPVRSRRPERAARGVWWPRPHTEGERRRSDQERGRYRDRDAETERGRDDPGDGRAQDVSGEVRAEDDAERASELLAGGRRRDVRDDERQARGPRPVQSGADERAPPIGERYERHDTERGAEPRGGDDGRAPERIGPVGGGKGR